jgi:FkbM family methyltransferase
MENLKIDKINKHMYYSQFKQDQFVNENFFKNKKDGFFVDIGAHNGITFSNSLFFEKLGWQGICVEPNPEIYKTLIANRNCQCFELAVSDKIGFSSFFQITSDIDMLSGLTEEFTEQAINRIRSEMHKDPKAFNNIRVKTDIFENIVNKTTKIDFLSLDTEGNELKILKTIDFNKYDIQVISVENNKFDNTFQQFFYNTPYNIVARLGCDEIYKKQP